MGDRVLVFWSSFRCGITQHYPLLPSTQIPAHPRSFFKVPFLRPVRKDMSNRYTRLRALRACLVAVQVVDE